MPRQKTGLKKVGDLLAKDKDLALFAAPTRDQQKLLDAAVLIRDEPGTIDKAAYMARQFIQATLPHSNPKGNPPTWTRVAGNVALSIRPGYSIDRKTSKAVCIGYPYGILPRLILFWMTRELVLTKSRRIKLGRTLTDFMRELDLDPSRGGKRSDASRLKDQMRRLFAAQISLDIFEDNSDKWLYMPVAPKGELWWDPKKPDQAPLFESWIEVGEDFFNSVMAHPVPVDMRALKALKRSPLALDLYAWTTYHNYQANKKRKDVYPVTWKQLHAVLGGEYSSLKEFGRKAKTALRKIAALSPGIVIQDMKGGFILRPGPLAIPEKQDR